MDFGLDYSCLAADPQFAALAQALSAQTRIDSRAAFNRFCRRACRVWQEQFGPEENAPHAQFDALLSRVMLGGDGVIRAAWGGVVVTLHAPPRVEKYLVVRRGAFLALEKHAEKDEHLEVREGRGLLLFRRAAPPILTVQALAPGDRFHFAPGVEHCVIGTDDLLVFEHGVDPKGMDQDLLFLYEPELPFGDTSPL